MAPKFQKGPDLKRFMDKKLKITLSGSGNKKRILIGTLRGYDAFLNIVLEHVEDAITNNYYGTDIVIRGNTIVQLEAMDRITIGGNIAGATTSAMES